MPRSATVRAVTDVEVLSLGRAAFTRLVGNCSRIIERNAALYEKTTAQLAATKQSVTKMIDAPPVESKFDF
jgi:CRP-like cAMP-binding protein